MALPLQQPSMTKSKHRRQRYLHRQTLITIVDSRVDTICLIQLLSTHIIAKQRGTVSETPP
jgi:hypothetical protein